MTTQTTYSWSDAGKGVKDDLTPAERAAWRKVVEEIKNG